MSDMKKFIVALSLFASLCAQAETMTVKKYLKACQQMSESDLQWGICQATKIAGWQTAQIALYGMDECEEYEFYTPNMAHARLEAAVNQGLVGEDLMVMAAFINVIVEDITCNKAKMRSYE